MRRSRAWTAAFVAIVLVAALILALPERDEGRSPVRQTGVSSTTVEPPALLAEPEPPARAAESESPTVGISVMERELAAGLPDAPEPKLTIEGIVLAKDGHTLVRAYVRAIFRHGPHDARQVKNVRASTFTNKEGRFRLKRLPPGSYRLVASHFESGRLPAAEFGIMPWEPLIVEAGTKDVQIQMIDGGWIRLELRDSVTARTITEEVTAKRYLPGGEARDEHLMTGVDGRATIRLLPGEEKRVRVFAEGYLPSELLTLRLPPDRVEDEFRVALQPDPAARATLRLRVLDPTGKPAERVRILDGFAPNVRLNDVAVTSLIDGWVEIPLAPGPRELKIFDATVGSSDYSRPWLVKITDLSVEKGEKVEQTVSLRIGGWVRVPPDSGFDPPRMMTTSSPVSTHLWLEEESGWWVGLALEGRVMIGGEIEDGRSLVFVGVNVRPGKTTEFIPLRDRGFGGR